MAQSQHTLNQQQGNSGNKMNKLLNEIAMNSVDFEDFMICVNMTPELNNITTIDIVNWLKS